MRRQLLSVGEVAARLGLSVDKVRELADAGELKAQRTPGGHRRFSEATVHQYDARGSGRKRTTPPTRARRRARVPVVDDLDDGIEEVSEELEWEEPDYPPAFAAAPAHPRNPAPTPHPAPPPPIQNQSRAEEEERRRKAGAEATRLQNLKTIGMASIPYAVPPIIRGKIVSDLESYVTANHLPEWIPQQQQQQLVRARVDAIVEAYRKQVAEDTERKRAEEARATVAARAKAEADRRKQQLVEHGKRYAQTGLREFEKVLERWEVEREIEQALQQEVRADWSERDVEALVDEVLDEETEDEGEST